jgi:segregation and condensation protein B
LYCITALSIQEQNMPDIKEDQSDRSSAIPEPNGLSGGGRAVEPGTSTGELITHVEALIFASDRPLTSIEITELVNGAFAFMDNRIGSEQIDTALEGIVEKYDAQFYPFEVRQSGGGWQFLTKKEYHKTVAQLNGEKFLKRLSAAALETLAIIAYKQPITKGEIESIRGVSSDYSVQKLLEKELIVIAGRNEKLPGHPLIYTTSKGFMDYFGINTADDLPKIKEALQEQMVEPTVIQGYTEAADEAEEEGEAGEKVADAEGAESATGRAPHTEESAHGGEDPVSTDDEPAIEGTPGTEMVGAQKGQDEAREKEDTPDVPTPGEDTPPLVS